jgi:hypothetical protein
METLMNDEGDDDEGDDDDVVVVDDDDDDIGCKAATTSIIDVTASSRIANMK